MSPVSSRTLLALGLAALSFGCGNSAGDSADPGLEVVANDSFDGGAFETADGLDLQPECTVDDDCKDWFDDLGLCETFYCDQGTAGGTCAKKLVADGTPCDDGDACTKDDKCALGQCVPGKECECRSDDDCSVGFGSGTSQCEVWFCDTGTDGGTCAKKAVDDGTPCDDEDACTGDDQCLSGSCAPGSVNKCDCYEDADCLPLEDGNKCNGTLTCDRQHFPYKCETDPFTVVNCDSSADTFCRQNTCIESTGGCEMTPANEGQPCEDDDACSEVSACQSGLCNPFEILDCDDGEPCTNDTCDSAVGCLHLPIEGPCDDGDACTMEDHCSEGKCSGGPPKDCDNGVFCDGTEACDPGVGCVGGVAPDCSDGNDCTTDACDPELDECVHVSTGGAIEGPLGSDTCVDNTDNDCDGDTDASDADCSFGFVQVDPLEGPSAGGTWVELQGAGLDTVTTVSFGGDSVPFEVLSPQRIGLSSPPHEAGPVSISVSNSTLEFVMAGAFTYLGKTDFPGLAATFVSPSAHVMAEGETLSGAAAFVEATVTPGPPGLVVQVGYGPDGSLPWQDQGWQWIDMTESAQAGDKTDFGADVTVALGGYLDMAVRFSVDGGINFEYGDMDGSTNGYDPSQAAELTVWGVAQAGDLVINELMWMGSNTDNSDEWFELRNMTRAPFDLGGFSVSNAGPVGSTFVFEAAPHVVNNLIIEPHGYFLVSEHDVTGSALTVQADIIGSNTMVLPNGGPVAYELRSADGTLVDRAVFTGAKGENGDGTLGEPDRSMERNVVPGDGSVETDWRTASAHEGWDGDPFQVANWGTPRGPNSDIPTCETDQDCAGSYPGIEPGQCRIRICDQETTRCSIVDVQPATPCDDGLYCTDSDACDKDVCSGAPRDCGDGDKCTLDSCDEDGDECVNLAKDCDDFDPCTIDSCDQETGSCQNVPKDCDDGDLCTDDGCDPVSGACFNDAKDCDDSDYCTVDSCLAATGECDHLALPCGDGDPCTEDTCDPVQGCLHGEPSPACVGCSESAQCADDSRCTGDTCEQGQCFHLPPDCDDQNPCTVDNCADLTGDCWYSPKDCDDGISCTIDSCAPDSGDCVHTLDPAHYEGPGGSPSCANGADDDCDGLTDKDDPQCGLFLIDVHPAELPLGLPWTIEVYGTGLDLVSDVLLGGLSASSFDVLDPLNLTASPQGIDEVGDYDLQVTDGTVTATLAGPVRVIGKAPAMWANTRAPAAPISIAMGESTPPIFGQVFAAGITDSGGDPLAVDAMLGYGPAGTDPFADGDWTWAEADWNPDCTSCGTTYEYTGTLQPATPGDYQIGFRFSIDGGFLWVYGDLGAGSSDGWNADTALDLTVTTN